MAIHTLNVRFGTISHGWLPITFGIADSDALVVASDVPADPIAPLVSLARFLLSAELGSRDVEFHLEPEYCTLTVTKTANSDIDVRLVQPGCDISQSGLSCVATATQIWRALRAVDSAVRAAIADNQWSWDFPTTQMDMLASEIETANAVR
ncbi:hypothetical protein CA13_31310 [Planctomycetes bacterium CA13]|uniref:Uncharacterized protein n=1 Tax=Novipirellula herctigrandis TaxID=2527986 RepID=A0A5C5Z2W8_9BACT|nr:hypothetical protein CA13_31310 [Planctomycetes bacterium CA13]